MPLTFYGIDNEFAAATGTNVGTTPNSSTFDNPPYGSSDLVITAHEGDNDPRLFEVGDSYDVTWGGASGGGSIINAVVVRSDAAPDGGSGGGIIVLEGTDQNGDIAQIIWTPGYDLEGWYNANTNPSEEPQFYTQDMQASYDHTYVCFAGATRIQTPDGHTRAQQLTAGDTVITSDKGPAKLVWTGQRIGAGTGNAAPVVFDPGSIGNSQTLRLSQNHRVLVRSPAVELLFGVPEALAPAKALINGLNIRLIACSRMCYVHLLLENHEILFAEGAQCESLLLGTEARKSLSLGAFDDAAPHFAVDTAVQHKTAARPILTLKEAQMLLGDDPAERDIEPLRQAL